MPITTTSPALAALIAERWPSTLDDEAVTDLHSEPTADELADLDSLAELLRTDSLPALVEVSDETPPTSAASTDLETLRRWVHETRRAEVTPRPRAENAWQLRAACTGRSDIMDATYKRSDIIEALDLCRSCPVLSECRAWVATEPAYRGVAGGDLHTDGVTKEKLLGLGGAA